MPNINRKYSDIKVRKITIKNELWIAFIPIYKL